MSAKKAIGPVALDNSRRGSTFFSIAVPGGVIRSVDREVLSEALKRADSALAQASKTLPDK